MSRHEYPLPREQQEVYDFIGLLRSALAEAKRFEESPTPELEESLRQKVIELRHNGGLGILRYPIRLKVAEGIHAETSLGDFKPEESIREDIITSFGDISVPDRKVEFYSGISNEGRPPHWFTVFGFDFDEMEPIID